MMDAVIMIEVGVMNAMSIMAGAAVTVDEVIGIAVVMVVTEIMMKVIMVDIASFNFPVVCL
jgi:hypothetical protein